jgi:hypothetical protein
LKHEITKNGSHQKKKGGQKQLMEERGFLPIDDKILCFLKVANEKGSNLE